MVWLHDLLNTSEAAVPQIDPQWNPMIQDFRKPDNVVQSGSGSGNPPDPITHVKPTKICKFFRFNGKCAAGRRCEYKHIQTGDSFHQKHEEMVNVVTGSAVRPPAVGSRHVGSLLNLGGLFARWSMAWLPTLGFEVPGFEVMARLRGFRGKAFFVLQKEIILGVITNHN